MSEAKIIVLSIALTVLILGGGSFFLIKNYANASQPATPQKTDTTADKNADQVKIDESKKASEAAKNQEQTQQSTKQNTQQANKNSETNKTDSQTKSDKPMTTDTQNSELIKKDDVIGTGTEVKSGDFITINYTGKLLDGTIFDSSDPKIKPGRTPFTTQIGVGQVIKGWDEGVVGMKVGGKRTLTIPASLGYGSQAMGGIPANSTLIFELELLDVKPKA